MSVTRTLNPLGELVALAKAGNRLLAEHQLRRQLHECPELIDDPAAWLWLAWLADSPQAMEQVLTRARERHCDNPMIQAGLQWARGLSQFTVSEAPVEAAYAPAEPEYQTHEPQDEAAIDSAESIVQGVQQVFGAPVGRSSASFKLTKTAEFVLPPPSEELVAETARPSGNAPVGQSHSVEDDIFSLVSEEPIAEEPVADSVAPPPSSTSPMSGAWYPAKDEPPVSAQQYEASTSRTNDRAGAPDARLTAKPKETQSPSKSGAFRAPEAAAQQKSGDTTVPKAGAKQPANTAPAANNGRGPSAHVLVVDDSPTVRKLLTLMLTQHGYGVSSAVDGVDAVKSIAANSPDLIITDINMPRLDGYKLCKLVTRNDKTRHIPVVMISAGVIDRLRGKLAGCTDYLTKPITPESLLSVVESSLLSAVR